MAGIWSEDSSETSTCRMHIHSPDFLSELNCLVAHPGGIWGIGCCSRDTTYLVSRKPKSLSPVLWELGWVLGQGVMKVGHCTQKLLPVISIFRVPFRIGECISGCDSMYLAQTLSPSCHVSSGKSSTILTWTADKCCMRSWNMIPIININRLFTFHGRVWSFYTRKCSWTFSVPTYLGPEKKNIYGSNDGYPSV